MARRIKTVEYIFPNLDTLLNAVVSNLPQITLYLPENNKTFRSVQLHVVASDIITATGGTINEYRTAIQLGAAGYNTVTNTNDIGNSGENITFILTSNFTGYFQTNWSGTSMTCDCQVYMDQRTGTTLGLRDVNAILYITYEYDDDSALEVKTVHIPLNAPLGALSTTKPGTAIDTIPILGDYLPEAGKTIRNMFVCVEGNDAILTTGDYQMNVEIDTLGAVTGTRRVSPLLSNRYYISRFNMFSGANIIFDTGTSHNFFLYQTGINARYNHPFVWMNVTYTFDPAATTGVMNNILLPQDLSSPMGGPSAQEYQRAERNLWIQESGISLRRAAVKVCFEQIAPIASLFARIGNGTFGSYTDTATTMCGGNSLMVRSDSGVSLNRGANTFYLDIYRTDVADFGFNVSALWYLNYISQKHPSGVGAHNHSIRWNVLNFDTVAAATSRESIPTGLTNSPSDYFFLNALGNHYIYLSNSTSQPAGLSIQFQRNPTGEGYQAYEDAYSDTTMTDAEVGIRQVYSQLRDDFMRWPGDSLDRHNIELNRKWRVFQGGTCTAFHHLDILATYHTIGYDANLTISGSNGGPISLLMYRFGRNDILFSGLTTGDSSTVFRWYDDTEPVYFIAYEDSSHRGISQIANLQTLKNFSINLAPSTGSSSSAGGFFGYA